MNTVQWSQLWQKKNILVVCALCVAIATLYSSVAIFRITSHAFERTLSERIKNDETVFFAQIQNTENLQKIMKNLAEIYHVQFPENRTYPSEEFAQIAIIKIKNDTQFAWAIFTREKNEHSKRIENHIAISSQKMADHLQEKRANERFQSNTEWQAVNRKNNNALYINLASLPMEITKSNQIMRALVRPYASLAIGWNESDGMLTLRKKEPSEIIESTVPNDTTLSSNPFPFSIEGTEPLKQGKTFLQALGQENKGLIQGMEGVLQATIQQSLGEKITMEDLAPYLQERTSMSFDKNESGKTIFGLAGNTQITDDSVIMNKSQISDNGMNIRTQQFFSENSRTDITRVDEKEKGNQQAVHEWNVQSIGQWYIGRNDHRYIISNERTFIEKMAQTMNEKENEFFLMHKAQIRGTLTWKWLHEMQEAFLPFLSGKNAVMALCLTPLRENAQYAWSIAKSKQKTDIRWQIMIQKNTTEQREEKEVYIK